jgi:hypothetical protein
MFYNNDFYDHPTMPMYPSMPGMPFFPMPTPAPISTSANAPVPPMPAPPVAPAPPQRPQQPPAFEIEPGAPVQKDILYTQGYMRTQIGRYVKIEFLIGTNMLIDREGTLKDVGISYVIIQEPETDDLLLCDIYSIKFVKFFY